MNKKGENLEIPKVRVMFDKIITSAISKKVTKGGLLLSEEVIASRQTVLVAGPTSGVEVGDEIEINTAAFPRENKGPKSVGSVKDIGPDQLGRVIVPIVEIEDTPYLYIDSRYIKWVYLKEDKLDNVTTTAKIGSNGENKQSN